MTAREVRSCWARLIVVMSHDVAVGGRSAMGAPSPDRGADGPGDVAASVRSAASDCDPWPARLASTDSATNGEPSPECDIGSAPTSGATGAEPTPAGGV